MIAALSRSYRTQTVFMTDPKQGVKFNAVMNDGGSAFDRYRDLNYGSVSLGRVLWTEFLFSVLGPLPGALGLLLRSKCFPHLFRSVGRGVVFGRNMTLRHPHKISIGDGSVFDDGSTLDAKGPSNEGIHIGSGVYLGRGSSLICKNGNISLGDRVNIGALCTVFSSNALAIGADTIIAAYCYFLSGGEYDYRDATPFSKQSGMKTEGPLVIGAHCWIGARVTVLDAATISDHCVIGAGAVVNKPIPANSLAVGIPAKVIRQL